MFESANLVELAKIAQSVITPEVVAGSKVWKLNEQSRHNIRVAMFGRGNPDLGMADASVQEQNALLTDFTRVVAGPLIELLPPHSAAFAVLMLYEEFVKAVFIQPVLEAEIGGEG